MYKMSKRSLIGRCALFPIFVIAWIPYAGFHYIEVASEWLSEKSNRMMDAIEKFANDKFPLDEVEK